MPKKKTTEQVLLEFRQVHSSYYDYSKVIYVNSKQNRDVSQFQQQ